MNINQANILSAFKQNQENHLRKVHLYLNKNYYNLIFNQDEKNILNEMDLYNLKHIENVWIEHEKSDCFNKYDCYKPIQSASEVENILREHSVYNHSIFSYLSHQASLEEIKYFIGNESILNLEFFDYLAYSIIGASEQAKLEIINNLWDEAGRGSVQLFHTVKFKKIMDDLEIPYDREKILSEMSWEGIAGINLFSYLALYSCNKMKYFGLLAATEMLDPIHYHQLLKGFSKFKSHKNPVNLDYYIEHETIDIVHANGWMQNVILPLLAEKPERTPEFWLGFYLRLDSAQRYYDELLNYFLSCKAA